MLKALKLHPDSHCSTATGIEVGVARHIDGHLVLQFDLTGNIADVLLPRAANPGRTDDLWHHTCFEAFVRSPPVSTYFEFNFSPSGQWAAYRFDSYRKGMRAATATAGLRIQTWTGADSIRLTTQFELEGVPFDAPWQMGLSAVIEETNGNKSYWALAHPPGKPDFHHSDCFALELAAPSRA